MQLDESLEFLRGVARYIRSNALLNRSDRVIVAVSGGLDSMVLLEVMSTLSAEHGWHIIVAHYNHGIRGGEAERDQAFVRAQSAQHGWPFVAEQAKDLYLRAQDGISLQAVAREARYAFFERVQKDHEAHCVATGHTRDDQAETSLLHLLRGAGLSGIAGMRARRYDGLIRPLLDQPRQRIQRYADIRGIPWMEDSSNLSNEYSRNRLRHHVLPLLRTFNPQVDQAIAGLAAIAAREDDLLIQLSKEAFDAVCILVSQEEARLDRIRFLNVPEALQFRVLTLLRHQGPGLGVPGALEAQHVERSIELIRNVQGTQSTCWPGGLALTVDSEVITLVRGAPELTGLTEPFDISLSTCGELRLPDGRLITARVHHSRPEPHQLLRSEVCWLDAETVGTELRVRFPRAGDHFVPLGMPRGSRLNRFLIGQKVPLRLRSSLPLVLSGEDIVWIAGVRTSEIGKLTLESRRFICLELRDVRGEPTPQTLDTNVPACASDGEK